MTDRSSGPRSYVTRIRGDDPYDHIIEAFSARCHPHTRDDPGSFAVLVTKNACHPHTRG